MFNSNNTTTTSSSTTTTFLAAATTTTTATNYYDPFCTHTANIFDTDDDLDFEYFYELFPDYPDQEITRETTTKITTVSSGLANFLSSHDQKETIIMTSTNTSTATISSSSKLLEVSSSGNDDHVRDYDAGFRIAFRTKSDIEIMDDGYKWRKYGKKKVKSNPNLRNYYRCSTTGCKVKKRVERDKEDPQFVITTYEGKHDHEIPSLAPATPIFQTNTASPCASHPHTLQTLHQP